MRRAVLFVLCLALLLGGCGIVPGDETTAPSVPTSAAPTASTAAPTEDPTVPQENLPVFQASMVSIALPLAHNVVTAEDGTVIFNGVYQNVSPMFQEPDIAQRVTMDLLDRIDLGLTDAETVLNAAREAYDASSGTWNPYYAGILYTPTRIDAGVLSLLGQYSSVAGGQAHPNHALSSVTYDLVTGKPLTFQDLVTEEFSAPVLCQLLLDALEPQKDSLYSEYETVVRNLFSRELTNWYLSPTGLCFYFAPYEIASYVTGTVVAEIPYGQLGGILRNEYFPEERGAYEGSPVVERFESADRDQFSQFTEVIVDRAGSRFLLSAQGTMLDLSIVQGSRSGDYFQPEGTIFAASSLSQGEAIMIQADPNAADQALQLTYTSGGTVVTEYIVLP